MLKTKKRISGWSVYLNSAPVRENSHQQNCVALYVTEAELVAASSCAQDMVWMKQVLKSLNLQVKLLMFCMQTTMDWLTC